MRHSMKGFKLVRKGKLHPRFTALMFSFYMSVIMALLMTMLITAVNGGLNADYVFRVWHSYQLAMPSAFVFVLMVRPLVLWLVRRSVHQG